jgi:chemotaxis signal transduction protein
LVDEVVGMTEANPARIAPVPALATLLNPAFFRGIFSQGDRVVLVLDGDGLGSMSEVVNFYGG